MEKLLALKTRGGSMRPFLTGSRTVMVMRLAADQLKTGDPVAYAIDGDIFIHRIWSVDKKARRFFIGDDGGVISPHSLPFERVIGKPLHMPGGIPGLLLGRAARIGLLAGRRLRRSFLPDKDHA